MDELLTLPEAAKAAQCNYDTLRKAASDGRLRAQKRGRDWFVTLGDVQQWLKDPEAHRRGRRWK